MIDLLHILYTVLGYKRTNLLHIYTMTYRMIDLPHIYTFTDIYDDNSAR
jgi:hypothetical protein